MSGWLAAIADKIGARMREGVELPPGSSVLQDLPYGPERAQRVDVYLPAGRVLPPLIVIVGGGAWSMGDKAAEATVARKVAHWLPAGHIVASIGYRRLPEAEPLEQAGDVARGLAFLQRFLVEQGQQAHDAVLIDSAALDVVSLMSGPHLPLHDRAFGASEAGWELASPLHRLDGRPAPVLLIHSSRRPFAGEQALAFAAAVIERGGQAEVLSSDLSHVDLNAELGRDPEYTQCVDTFIETLAARADDPESGA